MIFAVILSLAALVAADPEIQQNVAHVQQNVQEHQQQLQHGQQHQMVQDVNTIPFYKQLPQPSPLNLYEGYTNSRYSPYLGQMMENYPFLSYNYKNLMTYPYRSNYFLRVLTKPGVNVEQPKVDYGSEDVYHLRNVNHHHLVNNVHNIKEKHLLRKVGEIDTPFYPFSPMTYENYMSNYYNRGYPYFNKHYGKSFDQEYILPNNYYNRGYPYVNQYYGKSLDQEYIQPYNRFWDLDYIRNYYGRSLNFELNKPYNYGTHHQVVKPILTRKINVDYARPVISRELETDFIPKSLDVDYITPKNVYKPILSVKPTLRNFDIEYTRPAYRGNLDADYVQPINPETPDDEFQPQSISRNLGYINKYYPKNLHKNLDWTETPLNWNDWSDERIEDFLGGNRFGRSEPINVKTSVHMNHGVPVTKQNHQLVQGTVPESLRQDILLNTHAQTQVEA